MDSTHRSSQVVRLPDRVVAMLDEAAAELQAERGGKWSRGETARVIIEEWRTNRAEPRQ